MGADGGKYDESLGEVPSGFTSFLRRGNKVSCYSEAGKAGVGGFRRDEKRQNHPGEWGKD